MLDCFRVGHMHGNSGGVMDYPWGGLCEYHTQRKVQSTGLFRLWLPATHFAFVRILTRVPNFW